VNHADTRLHPALALVVSFAVVFAAAALGAWASADAPSFYAQLQRPGWAPPASVFGPAWTLLYALMAVSAWLFWRAGGAARSRLGLPLFAAQRAANALWSWLFFAWRQGAWAFAEVIVLALLIAATIAAFRRVQRLAAALLLPYLAWVCFASALTWACWQRNPALLG